MKIRAVEDAGAELMTIGAVARTLGMSVEWANVLVRRGRLAEWCHTSSGMRLFQRTDVEALQREREEQKRAG